MKILDNEEYVITIIMAAGKGTRMKSNKSKLVHKIYGKELVKRVAELAYKIGSDDVVAVVGHMREQVQEVLGDSVKYAYQDELLGTGHAVMQAAPFLEGKKGKVVVLYGDVPIIRPETLKKLIEKSVTSKEYATLLTAIYENPTGYGRIIKDNWGKFVKIVEQKDATLEEQRVDEINSGIYVFDSAILSKALGKLTNDNVQGEYYLTDTIEIVKSEGLGEVATMIVSDDNEIKGVNSPEQLEEAEEILKARQSK